MCRDQGEPGDIGPIGIIYGADDTNAKKSTIRVNIERMDSAISSERFVIPDGLTGEQLRQFLLSHAESIGRL